MDYEHVDMLGNVIKLDDIVVAYATISGGHVDYPKHSIVFGKVIKLSPKTVLVSCIKITGREKERVRIGEFSQIAVIDEGILKSLMKRRLEII